MAVEEKDRIELGELNRYIQKIGDEYGALGMHFKTEDAAERLPPPYHRFVESDTPNDFGLRLYCIRLTPSVVILLNGDRKTSLKVSDCNNCRRHFNTAKTLANKIDNAIVTGDIEIDNENREIIINDDFELEI